MSSLHRIPARAEPPRSDEAGPRSAEGARERLRVLLVEASPADAARVVDELKQTRRPIDFERVATPEAMREALAQTPWDVVVSDWSLPNFSGRAALDLLRELQLDLPFIIVSATGGAEHAVAAIRAGAHDYVLKDDLGRLAPVLERELRDHQTRQALKRDDHLRREAEQRMRRMIEAASVGVWFVAAQGLTSFMNQRMAQILGLRAEDAAHASIDEFLDPEEARADAMARAGTPSPAGADGFARQFHRKDGTPGWGVLESSTLYDKEGRFEGVLTVMTDVTERRRTEEAYREAELRFKRIFDSGIIGVIVVRMSGEIVEANDAFLDIVGYSREDLRTGILNWEELTPEEWRPLHVAAGRELAERGRCRPFEKEYARKDGTRVRVLVGLALLREGQVLALVTNLTDRKVAEERKSALVDTALDGVIAVDDVGAITEWNPSAAQMFGYPRDEVLGRPLADVVMPPHVRVAHRLGLAHYLATGDGPILGKRLEVTAVRRDGVEFPAELSVSRVGSGATPSFVGFVRDISERKRFEAALVERARVAALGSDIGMALTGGDTLAEILQRCCEAVVSHLGAAFSRIWTLDGAKQIFELQASAGMYTNVDGPRARVPIGASQNCLLTPELKAYVSNDLEHDPRVSDRGWARREGMRSLAGQPLLVRGEPVGVLGMFAREPISEVALKALASIADAIAVRIQGKLAEEANLALEEQLRQSQKMEAVGRLAGGIAHDFNNLLSVILSYSEMLIADLKAGDPIRTDLEEVRRAGTRAAELTRQLLVFSRQQILEPKVLDLNEVLSGMEKMLRRLVGEDVELTSVPAATPARIRADRGSIEQVIMNLAINARDAMPVGGKLTMETGTLVLDDAYASRHVGTKAGPHVMLSVTDNGTGMDKETCGRIFDPFFTTKETGKGTGLGLSTVFGIVQQSGGNIWVYSEPGLGTAFKVYLPRVDDPADDWAPQKGSKTVRGSETILLVEDEDQVRDVARGILRRYGYAVLDARNGGEALLLCEGHPGPIHLLLSDVVMPQMSGPVLAKRLAPIRPEMKVLCMSGYTDDAAVRHGVIDSAFAYLQKPITVEGLTKKVREVLDYKPSPA